MTDVMSMSPTLIHPEASGSSPNDKGEWTQTARDKYCISWEEKEEAMEPGDTKWRWDAEECREREEETSGRIEWSWMKAEADKGEVVEVADQRQ